MSSNRSSETRPPTLRRASSRNATVKRRSNTIPWIRLTFILVAQAIIGAWVPITPAWAGAPAGAVIGAFVAVNPVETSDRSKIEPLGGLALGMFSGGVVGAVTGALLVGGDWPLEAFLGGQLGSWTGFVTGFGDELLESSNRSHTFVILAGTSLAGLGLGWLIGVVLRSFGFVLPV